MPRYCRPVLALRGIGLAPCQGGVHEAGSAVSSWARIEIATRACRSLASGTVAGMRGGAPKLAAAVMAADSGRGSRRGRDR